MVARRRSRWLGALLCAGVVIAACGGDDDDDGTSGTPAETEATEAETEATEGGAETTSAPEETEAEGTSAPEETEGTTGGGEAGGGDLDAENGQGASALLAALEATADAPLAADDSLEPFVVAMVNLEGTPGGSFPDVQEGAEAALAMINERLGGIGADIEAGVGGRPIELVYCGHVIDQNEAQACANQLVDANPNVIVPGVDFFTPLMYPLFGEFPVIEMQPIFIADFDQPGVYGVIGGCANAFPASAQMIAEIKGHDRLGVIWAENAPGTECWQDTQERFYNYFAETLDNFEFSGFPYTPGEQAGFPAVVQQVSDYIAGAENPSIFLGIAAQDCASFIQGIRNAGIEAPIYTSSSCDDLAVRGLPESEGTIFEVPGYITEQADLYNDFVQQTIAERQAAIEAYGPESPESAFMRSMFATMVFVYQIADTALADGVDIDDREAFRTAIGEIDNFHLLGFRPISCADNPTEYESICNRKTSFAVWDGETLTPDPDIPDDVIDVTELLIAVEESNPRG